MGVDKGEGSFGMSCKLPDSAEAAITMFSWAEPTGYGLGKSGWVSARAVRVERLAIGPLNFGVIANVSAEVNRDAARIKPLLLEQITGCVRWEESMATLSAAGIVETIEFGAGRILAGLMRRINRNIKVRAAEDSASVRATIQALAAGTGE